MSAVKFRHLAKVPEIVVGKFVEQLRHADRPHLVMAAGAPGGRGGDSVQEDNVAATQGDEMLQMLASGFLLNFLFGGRDILRQRGIFLYYHTANSLAVSLFDDRKMRQHLLNRPAFRRR